MSASAPTVMVWRLALKAEALTLRWSVPKSLPAELTSMVPSPPRPKVAAWVRAAENWPPKEVATAVPST